MWGRLTHPTLAGNPGTTNVDVYLDVCIFQAGETDLNQSTDKVKNLLSSKSILL